MSYVSYTHHITSLLGSLSMMRHPESAEVSATARPSAGYQELTVEETLRLLESTTGGLQEADAESRTHKFGHNEIAEEKQSAVKRFLSHYWGPMPWLLEFTILLSLLLGHLLNAVIVFILLTINVSVGFVNSSRSQKALKLLRKRVATRTNVLRDGEWKTTESRNVVPGDVIQIGLGEIVSADSKLIGGEVFVDESALTGESLSVPLHEADIVYSGATVVEGEARCVVVNTGESTAFGNTGRLVRMAHPASHQMTMVLGVTRFLLRFSLMALILTSIYAFVVSAEVSLILTLVVMFLMGSIPVALPAVLAVVESVGSLELAHKGALVTRLDSVEDAASIDVVCIDKTGTITQNWLSIVEVAAFAGHSKGDVSLAAALASKVGSKDPIDELIIGLATSRGLRLDSYEQVSFTPFAPTLKRSEAIIKDGNKEFRVVKGAPHVVMSLCSSDQDTTAQFNSKLEEFSQRGHRSLAVAESDPDNPEKLNLIGLLAMANPIRPDSKDMIEQLRRIGVRPIMLTGDSLSIAREIGRQASVGERIVRLSDVKDALDSHELHILDYDGFAEIFPEDKYKIVSLLQSYGHFVGMTGDGVNDAPALKQAEMGIAVKSATDVAKASASIVLTEDGVGVITEAIMTSRRIYQRMLSWVINKVAKTVQIVGILTLGFVWLQDLAITLTGMVLIVLSNDFPTMSLATDNVKGTPNPDAWNMKNIALLGLTVGLLLIAQGILTILVGLDVFSMNTETLSGFLTLTLIFTSQFRILIVRERRRFWSSRPGNGLVTAVIGTSVVFSVVGVLGIIIPAITYAQLLFALLISGLFTLILVDPVKYWVSKKLGF